MKEALPPAATAWFKTGQTMPEGSILAAKPQNLRRAISNRRPTL
jgi:hypothetical protein